MQLKRNPFFIRFLDACLWLLTGIPAGLERLFASSRPPAVPERILVLELWGLGDLVMMTAVLKPLRDLFPRARICLLAKPISRELLLPHPYIDEIFPFDFPWTRFSGKYLLWRWDWRSLVGCVVALRKRRFDLCVDARGDLRNNLFAFLIGAGRRIGYGDTGGGYLLTDRLPNNRGIHRVAAWQQITRHLGAPSPGALLLWVTDAERLTARQFMAAHVPTGFAVGIHPGARIKSRCWPVERFAQVLRHLQRKGDMTVLAFVEPDGYGAELAERPNTVKVQQPLRAVVALVAQLQLLICNDSGMMHVAAAFGVPTIAIFGPGDEVRIGPVNPCAHIVKTRIECSPCDDACVWKSAICLERVSASQVTAVVDRLTQPARAPGFNP